MALQHGAFFFLDILHLLNKVRDGFFEAVYLIPPATSGPDFATAPQQDSLRSDHDQNPKDCRRWTRSRQKKCDNPIVNWSPVSWLAAQSARCKVRRVGMVLIFPEDFGAMHVRDGPASPWSSREFQDLERACDVRRGSAFLCQLASTDQRRPVGILTNLPTLQSRLSLHWPILEKMRRRIILPRPTPRIMPLRSSPCSVQGNGCREEHFVSSSSQSPGHSVLDSLLGRSQRVQPRFP